jgi:hypothetical protein
MLLLLLLMLLVLHVFINANIVGRLPFKVGPIEVLGKQITCVCRCRNPTYNEQSLFFEFTEKIDLCGDMTSSSTNAPIMS